MNGSVRRLLGATGLLLSGCALPYRAVNEGAVNEGAVNEGAVNEGAVNEGAVVNQNAVVSDSTHRQTRLLQVPLAASDGRTRALGDLLAQSRYTVIVFFSQTCPCVRVHDGRLVSLAQEFQGSGVQWIAVDSELGANVERARAERQSRHYPFPLLVDADGHLAATLEARYASQVVVLDRFARVHYSGAIDSDKNFLHADATPYLFNALQALLRGEPAPAGEHRALGCGLRLR